MTGAGDTDGGVGRFAILAGIIASVRLRLGNVIAFDTIVMSVRGAGGPESSLRALPSAH